jgi:hypothetical protein
MIPNQLQNEEFRFVKVRANDKVAVEKAWNTKNNYRYDDPQLLEWIKAGNNYGVMGGHGELVIIDADKPDVVAAIKNILPATFRVNDHFYYICQEARRTIRLLAGDGKHGTPGDVISFSKYAVGPGCLHPSGKRYAIIEDIPIAEVSLQQIELTLSPWLDFEEKTENYENALEGLDFQRILGKEFIKTMQHSHGFKFYGSHPIHGSESGQNFHVDTKKNVWYCFRHQSGGGIPHLIAVLNGVIECHESKPGKLMGELFKNTLGIAKELYGIDIGFKETFVNPFKNLRYPTQHLHGYKLLDSALMLYGSEYTLLKKYMHYFMGSLPLREKKVMLGSIDTDLRLHAAIPLKSDKGKKNLQNLIENVSNCLNMQYSEPTSLHPEQLVGRVIKRKATKEELESESPPVIYEKIKGYLADDVMVVDEASELITSNEPHYKESRMYINKATNPHPSNTITKRMVDTQRDNALKYNPSCNIVLFTQPFPMNFRTVLLGFARRFIWGYVNLSPFDPMVYQQRVYGVGKAQSLVDIQDFSTQLRKMQNLPDEFTFSDQAKSRLLALHLQLIQQGRIHSNKGAEYTELIPMTLQNTLVKFSCIQAAYRLENEVTELDVENAFIDLTEMWQHYLDFIDEYTQGALNYSVIPRNDSYCLSWLEDQGALKEATSKVTIDEYIKIVQDFCGLTDEGARKRYYKHKENAWVNSEQKGQHGSRVWLTRKPQGVQGVQGGKVVWEYFNLVNNKRLLSGWPPLPPLPP